MSYYACYDGILILLERLCKKARIVAVSKNHGAILKNTAKYSFWHPFSQKLHFMRDVTILKNALQPSELCDKYKGWTHFVGPNLTAEIIKTEPTLDGFLRLMVEHSWNYIQQQRLFRNYARYKPPHGEIGMMCAWVIQDRFVAHRNRTRWPDVMS